MLNFAFKAMEKQAPTEHLRSLYFCESGIQLLTNTAFSILAITSRAVNRRASDIDSAEEV